MGDAWFKLQVLVWMDIVEVHWDRVETKVVPLLDFNEDGYVDIPSTLNDLLNLLDHAWRSQFRTYKVSADVTLVCASRQVNDTDIRVLAQIGMDALTEVQYAKLSNFCAVKLWFNIGEAPKLLVLGYSRL